MDVALELARWYKSNKRNLPWRETSDPYFIWLSEIILQQTRVSQGLPYYLQFIKVFPAIKKLASASEDKVLKLWEGLGYYSRARNMHATAKIISEQFEGKFPESFHELIKLKGIGDYTAAAIASFAFNKAHPVVDGNVMRFTSRYFGITTPLNASSAKKEYYELARAILDRKNPALHNQAIMEFGALQCVPVNPDCEVCPLQAGCNAFNNKMVSILPVKIKKSKPRTRYFHYFLVKHNNQVLISKRKENDIWKNLYELPLIEKKASNPVSTAEFKKLPTGVLTSPNLLKQVRKINYIHKLTHQTLDTTFYFVETKAKIQISTHDYLPVSLKDLKKYAVPRPINRFLEEHVF